MCSCIALLHVIWVLQIPLGHYLLRVYLYDPKIKAQRHLAVQRFLTGASSVMEFCFGALPRRSVSLVQVIKN
jgi:hypothetical protein